MNRRGPITVADLDRMPNDGRRYELMDGTLVVGPRPTTVHQFVAMRLATALDRACPDELCVMAEPAVQLSGESELAPDLVIVHLDEVGGAKFTAPPLLVVEVRSPSTALIDLNRKKAVYEKFGVPSYWIVDLEHGRPERHRVASVHTHHHPGRLDPRPASLVKPSSRL